MQEADIFHTGYDDYGIQPSGLPTRTPSQNSHYASLRGGFAGNQEQLEQQTQHTQHTSISGDFPPSILDLSPQESTRLCNIISSANIDLLNSLIWLSPCEPVTFELCHDLWRHGMPRDSVSRLAPGIDRVTALAWTMLEELGADRRRLLIPYLQEKRSKLTLQVTPEFGNRIHSTAPKSVVGTSSPGSDEFSTTSTTSSAPGPHSFHCPVPHCTHKPEGYKKQGYCSTHMQSKHSWWTQANPDWKQAIEVRPATADTCKRKRRGPHTGSLKKTKTRSNTPSDTVNRSGAILSGIDTGVAPVPFGNYSLTDFERDIGQASQQSNPPLHNYHYEAATGTSQMHNMPGYSDSRTSQWEVDVEGCTLQAPTTPSISVTPPFPSPAATGLNNLMFGGSTLNQYRYSDGDGYRYPAHRRSSAPGGADRGPVDATFHEIRDFANSIN